MKHDVCPQDGALSGSGTLPWAGMSSPGEESWPCISLTDWRRPGVAATAAPNPVGSFNFFEYTILQPSSYT
ncbi:unnamed protein product [Angiostrongylus costaricensis]|uniref:Uncharacterized protein n=1 Tax=Angiostrongylus costaricensis TaxID=334426 RepID=A0A0R3PKS9_ANGCS|nr:unnamed protein product [Angiostrongylus costaricensis]